SKMKNKKAFTLVELIVTIIILAILGTIVFISLQGYSQTARDSVRISDISRMKNSLNIFAIEAGKYPKPSDSVFITYSGGIIWEQGIFGESTFANVDKLDKIPTDPSTNSPFTYSITQNKLEFQIGGILENSDNSFFNSNIQSYAGNSLAKALIVGNYNGFAAKSLTGNICNIITVPSIITNDTVTSTNYEDIINNESLVFDGFQNLPDSFSKSRFKHNGGFKFSPNSLIVYSGSCNDLVNNELTRLNFIKNLQNSYSGTIIQNHGNLKTLINLNTDLISPSNDFRNSAGILTNIITGSKIQNSLSNDDISGICTFNGININNGNNVIAYSQNNISNSETYDCSDISEVRTCSNGVLDGDQIYNYSSCYKGTIDNCLANPNLNVNSHFYNISTINHSDSLYDINSYNVSENNGVFKYKLNSISCNDGVYVNINEDPVPTLISCDFGFNISGNSCIAPGEVIVTGVDNLSCPGCSN
ncbi:MAG: type II secretion system protein, partial [Candidatus Gracilibacteria bacterium]|nr:type II secretion system protein [Candidatus Gracilibacteria bacterium]